jgi:hypothetical protein
MSKSAIFEAAARLYAKMRTDYESYLEYTYNTALDGTGGVLVNSQGRALGIDGLDLFSGHKAYAMKYASEELLDWWKLNPRLTQAEYEARWITGETAWQELEQ